MESRWPTIDDILVLLSNEVFEFLNRTGMFPLTYTHFQGRLRQMFHGHGPTLPNDLEICRNKYFSSVRAIQSTHTNIAHERMAYRWKDRLLVTIRAMDVFSYPISANIAPIRIEYGI